MVSLVYWEGFKWRQIVIERRLYLALGYCGGEGSKAQYGEGTYIDIPVC